MIPPPPPERLPPDPTPQPKPLQDFVPKSVKALLQARNGKRTFNPQGKPPVHTWLAHKSSPLDKQRLHAMGNIVIPAEASVALDLFAHTCLI